MVYQLFTNDIYARLAQRPHYHVLTNWEKTLEDWSKELVDPAVAGLNSALSEILRDAALNDSIIEGRRKLCFGFPAKSGTEPNVCFSDEPDLKRPDYPHILYTFCKGMQIVADENAIPQILQCDSYHGQNLVYFFSCWENTLAASYLRDTHTGDSISKSLDQAIEATLRMHIA